MATEQTVVSMLPANPGSPDWYVKHLYEALMNGRDDVDLYDDYYSGEHPLPWLPEQARDEFRRILRMTRTNYMGLVVDSKSERIAIEGFRFGDQAKGDDETWDLWQANDMDGESSQAVTESMIAGTAFYFVSPPTERMTVPVYWGTECAADAIVAYEPGTRRRVRKAGLKVWQDEWTNKQMVTLYIRYILDNDQPDVRIYKYEVVNQQVRGAKPRIARREVPGEEWGGSGKMEDIPLIPILNNPRMRTGGQSELHDLIDVQDRINKTVADRLITQDFGAFPQKWATAFPDRDEDGNINKIDIGRDRMVKTDIAETKFGQWDSAPLDPYSLAKREDVKDIASRSRTPAQYLLGEMSNVNGETLKASESGLIAAVRQRMRYIGEASEEAARVARKIAGLNNPNEHRMETIFSNPEFRTEGEVVDATVKKLQTRIATLRQARQDVGYSETQIQAMEKDDINEAVPPVLAQALRGVRQPDGTTSPPISG